MIGSIVLAVFVTAQAPSAGAKIFADRCVTCHGEDGAAATAQAKKMKATDLRSEAVQKKSDADIIAAMAKVRSHPAFQKTIGDQGLKDVVTFMRTLKK
jgi:mono/diheme cytochrome c family protein